MKDIHIPKDMDENIHIAYHIIANTDNNATVHKQQNEYMYHCFYSMKYYKTIKKN